MIRLGGASFSILLFRVGCCRYVFEDCIEEQNLDVVIKWALPGKERQDSVFNGFQEIDDSALLVSIHDSARPLVSIKDVSRCLLDAMEVGAAVLGVPVKPTIKEVDSDHFVERTLLRSKLWEVQTPQVRNLFSRNDRCNRTVLGFQKIDAIVEQIVQFRKSM